MNKLIGMKGIEWATDTINPITGCSHGCPYCYARTIAGRLEGRFGYPKKNPFKVTFHPGALAKIRKISRTKQRRIFLDSMGDWFDPAVKPDWIHQIVDIIWNLPLLEDNQLHGFFVLTKRPDRIPQMLHCIDLPPNLWLGVSITQAEDCWRIKDLMEAPGAHKFLSLEPLLGPVGELPLEGIEWVIVGAETGKHLKPPVQRPWIDNILRQIPKSLPIFLKPSLNKYFEPGETMPQQFPEEIV